jgi:hypothetical protein
MLIANAVPSDLPMRRILHTWWPLAASWLLMGLELPLLSAVVARLPLPEINLAAFGGIVYPLALIIEAPIIMLLAASTALSKDWASYQKLRRFMLISGGVLTLLHILLAFTPLYYWVVNDLLGVPPEIVEPGRIGLMIMTPWTWAIAYRRFNQGVMIRFGHSDAVGIGTVVRLLADVSVLTVGFYSGRLAGIVVASCAIVAGVISEAIYTRWRVQPILREDLQPAAPVEFLTWSAFYRFYIPLALTSLLLLIWQPIGSAALSRMPKALESLAVWPVVSGLIFMLRSMGMAYNEVVVALLDEPRSYYSLKRFTIGLAITATLLHLVIAVTPLSELWFGVISALPLDLAAIASAGFLLALPVGALNVLQSWFQGALVQGRHTRGIPESVVVFLVTILAVFSAGIAWGQLTGLYVVMFGFVLAGLAQTLWLWYRSQSVLAAARWRDGQYASSPAEVVATD